jgi:hypothetical protein
LIWQVVPGISANWCGQCNSSDWQCERAVCQRSSIIVNRPARFIQKVGIAGPAHLVANRRREVIALKSRRSRLLHGKLLAPVLWPLSAGWRIPFRQRWRWCALHLQVCNTAGQVGCGREIAVFADSMAEPLPRMWMIDVVEAMDTASARKMHGQLDRWDLPQGQDIPRAHRKAGKWNHMSPGVVVGGGISVEL